jgi:hypothetical protein
MQTGPSIQYAGGSMPPTLNGVFPPTHDNQWCLEWVDKNQESLDLIARTAAMPMSKLRRKRRKKKAR